MGATLTRHLKVQHNIQWQSGYSRFRYKLDSDGYYRLQTVRYDSIELVEKLNRQQNQQQTETKTNEGEITESNSENDVFDNFPQPLSLVNSTDTVDDTVVNIAFGQLINVIEQEFAVTSESSSTIGMINHSDALTSRSTIADSNSKFEDQNGADSMDLENIFNSSFNFIGLNKNASNLNSTFDTMQF